MSFPFNFIIIPGIIIATAVIGGKHARKGVDSWYNHLHKPKGTPPGKLIGEIWFFLYVITGLAVLWYWNVSYPGWTKYLVGGVLLINAYYNATWNKVFFVEHNLGKAHQFAKRLFVTAVIAAGLMAVHSFIAAFLMLPYIVWLAYATKLARQIQKLNHQQSHQQGQHQNN